VRSIVTEPVVNPTVQAQRHVDIATRITTRHAVRPSDLDSLGHVNNAAVLEYLEYGRWEWLKRFGLRLATYVVPVVTRVEVDYRCEIFMCDLAITTDLAGESFYRIVFNQTVDTDADTHRKTAAEATVHVAFIDASSRRARRVRDALTNSSRSTVVSDSQKGRQHGRKTSVPGMSVAGPVASTIAGGAAPQVDLRSTLG
jgi:acyl-CoA thioesterase FadM